MGQNSGTKRYKWMVSATILQIVSVIMLIAGIILVISGFSDESVLSDFVVNPKIYIGLICIISSPLLFIIAVIADDIHYQRYLQECMVNKTKYYYATSLEKLESIEAMLQQLDKPSKSSKKSRYSSYPDL